MKRIVITSPDFLPGEASAIIKLLDSGTDTIHLRKPEATIVQCRELLDQIPASYRKHIVLHQYFELCDEYELQGIHLNKRNPYMPANSKGTVSCSCHSLDEVVKRKPTMDYVFLSPIFDSISKQGYCSAFSIETLKNAQQEGIIDEKVIALGGVTYSKLPLLESLSFGGAAMLGEIWNTLRH